MLYDYYNDEHTNQPEFNLLIDSGEADQLLRLLRDKHSTASPEWLASLEARLDEFLKFSHAKTTGSDE